MADVTKSAVGHYAEYEQLVGGVETLFKDSSGKLIDYAEKAYKTAGMSSNQYMNTATSFAASLIQGWSVQQLFSGRVQASALSYAGSL